MLGQRAERRLLVTALLNVRIDADVLAPSGLRLCEYFVDRGQLLIFNGQLLVSRAKQTTLERFKAEFEMALFVALLLAKLLPSSDRFPEGQKGNRVQ